MIVFAADNHYEAHPGRVLYEKIRERYPLDFYEDDWSCKSAHPLVKRLHPIAMPNDELYINLEFTSPVWPLMETTVEGGTFIQAYENPTPSGGRILSFLPGHARQAFENPDLNHTVCTMLDDLLG